MRGRRGVKRERSLSPAFPLPARSRSGNEPALATLKLVAVEARFESDRFRCDNLFAGVSFVTAQTPILSRRARAAEAKQRGETIRRFSMGRHIPATPPEPHRRLPPALARLREDRE